MPNLISNILKKILLPIMFLLLILTFSSSKEVKKLYLRPYNSGNLHGKDSAYAIRLFNLFNSQFLVAIGVFPRLIPFFHLKFVDYSNFNKVRNIEEKTII